MLRIVNTEFGEVEYSLVGEGKPVLIFHGGHSNAREDVFQCKFDLKEFQFVTPSRPGYGATSLGDNQPPEDTAKLFKALLDEIGIKKVSVIGISAGGPSALAFAAIYPEHVTKMVLVSAVTKKWLEPDDPLYLKAKRIFSPKVEKWSWKAFRTMFRLAPRQITKVLFEELSTIRPANFTEQDMNDVREMTFKQSSGEGFVCDLDQEISDELLTRIKIPVLIMHSKNDNSVPVEMAEHAHTNIRDSVLKIYDNQWGHLLWIGNDSQPFIRDINQFLEM